MAKEVSAQIKLQIHVTRIAESHSTMLFALWLCSSLIMQGQSNALRK